MGLGSSSGTSGESNAFQTAPGSLLATRLAALGVPTSNHSGVWGDYGAAVSLPTYDTRATLGTGWASGLAGGVAGNLIYFTGASVGNLTFLPTTNVDTFTIYTVKVGGGTAAVKINGGSTLATITSAGSGSNAAITVTATAGSNTLSIVPNADGNVVIEGIVAYLSTTPAIDIISLATAGITAGYYSTNSNSWGMRSVLPVITPDLTLIELTTNDSNTSTGVSTYTANLQTLIIAAQLTGDVVLASGISYTGAGAANLPAYIAAAKTLAAQNNIQYFDLNARQGSYTLLNSLGLMYDTIHPNALGYQDVAQYFATMLAFQ